MSILRRLTERRDISFQTVWGSGGNWGETRDEAGVAVNQTSALHLTTAYACVSLLTDTISTLPVGAFTRSGKQRFPVARPGWMFQPEADNPSSTWETHIAEVMFSLLLDGNAFVLTVRSPDDNEVLEVRALDPESVEPKRLNGKLVYEVRNGTQVIDVLDVTQVRHLWRLRRPGTLRGLSPIEAARQSIGKAMAAEIYGNRFFGRGATLSGVVQVPGPLAKEAADELRDKFTARFGGTSRSFGVGVLTNGAEWKPLAVTPEQAQFLGTLQQGVEDVARLFRVPPHMVGSQQPGAVSYASVEHRGIEFEKFTVRPYVEAIESAYRSLLPPGQFLQLNTNALLRGDFKTRMEGYATGVQNGITLRSEARSLEDLPPIDGADRPMVPLNLSDPANADLTQRVAALGSLIRAGFDPTASAEAVGLPPIAHTGLTPANIKDDPAVKGITP